MMEKAEVNFKNHGFTVHTFVSGREAVEFLCAELKDTSIGFGGCVTAQQLGLYEALRAQNRVYWHWTDGDRQAAQQNAAGAAVYILSANALSETGEIVNIDGNGNRLASAFFGHERVIFVCGRNKLAPDLPAAIQRARNVAAPLNARRLKRNTPCALSEPMRCHDCRSADRICSGMSILYEKMGSIPQMDLILIDEDLGY